MRKQQRRFCYFCKEKIDYIDYKDLNLLRKYISDKGKIRPRRVTGTCAQHQSELATTIKRARELALIPYTSH
ncbi:30S ribosomal protein S18 [Candidatus Hakubella thermalkaliphila]|uniref:30S ribosomal protein S18 n=1 Tax=Candidatus Hakubella thermalkaliphila TaxID=2754717 RepID=UPI0015943CE5|nr:30S ribosomal protein S18 [Candidatus Hakubella thermalkaliphila]